MEFLTVNDLKDFSPETLKENFPIKENYIEFLKEAVKIIKSKDDYFTRDCSNLKSDLSLKNVVKVNDKGKFISIGEVTFLKINWKVLFKVISLSYECFKKNHRDFEIEITVIDLKIDILRKYIESKFKEKNCNDCLKTIENFYKNESDLLNFRLEERRVSQENFRKLSNEISKKVKPLIFKIIVEKEIVKSREKPDLSALENFFHETLHDLESYRNSYPKLDKVFSGIERTIYRKIGIKILEAHSNSNSIKEIFLISNFVGIVEKIFSKIEEKNLKIYSDVINIYLKFVETITQNKFAQISKGIDTIARIENREVVKNMYEKVLNLSQRIYTKFSKEDAVDLKKFNNLEKSKFKVVHFLRMKDVKFSLDAFLKTILDPEFYVKRAKGFINLYNFITQDQGNDWRKKVEFDIKGCLKSLIEKVFELKNIGEFSEILNKDSYSNIYGSKKGLFEKIMELLECNTDLKNVEKKPFLTKLKETINQSNIGETEKKGLSEKILKLEEKKEEVKSSKIKTTTNPKQQKVPKKKESSIPSPKPSTASKTNKIAPHTILLIVASVFSALPFISVGIAATVTYLAPYLGIFTVLATLPMLQIFIITAAFLIPTIVAGALWIAFAVSKNKANASDVRS